MEDNVDMGEGVGSRFPSRMSRFYIHMFDFLGFEKSVILFHLGDQCMHGIQLTRQIAYAQRTEFLLLRMSMFDIHKKLHYEIKVAAEKS